jgi:hypothetical protein
MEAGSGDGGRVFRPGGASPWTTWQNRQWAEAAEVLHQLVGDHFEAFGARVATRREGQGLPQFVEDPI